ncbi:hypothetical protein QJS04_geneDACA011489 [Acorus gramineus]|uniref:MULE transposase domain-containing protein n=1 Tax=Acorus gramineus TaxID=55184 RepID=A0AAV9A308_ACOGR|nr:hypothetical protein QJS04_geneDACA011489 [Acorus gramineus]
MDRIRADHHYTISYSKANRAKWKAMERIFGNWEESYAELPLYVDALRRSNPGTTVFFEGPVIQENNMGRPIRQFERVFWAFGPALEAFKHCRPLVCIDGTHLYGKYKGTLLIATACDAENGLLPIAFAIVESENRSSWTFFLWNLFFSVGGINNLCVISDRHLGIIAGMKDIEESTNVTWYHRFCMRHMIDNFKKHVKSKELSDQVWRAATLCHAPGRPTPGRGKCIYHIRNLHRRSNTYTLNHK